MRSVKQMWDSFAYVLPGDAPDVQRTEMRRAFYAGAWGVLMEAHAIGEESVSEAAGIAHLEALRAELMQFHADLRAGKA